MNRRLKKRTKDHPFAQQWQQRFSLYCEDHSAVEGIPSLHQWRIWIWHALKNHYHSAQIGLMLLPTEEARAYNRDYRNKDYATNVLSFESECSQIGHTLYGDMIICPQVVVREAQEQGKSIQAHFAHLCIHGTLHLMGHDHLDDDQALHMETTEINLLAQLGFANPYL